MLTFKICSNLNEPTDRQLVACRLATCDLRLLVDGRWSIDDEARWRLEALPLSNLIVVFFLTPYPRINLRVLFVLLHASF